VHDLISRRLIGSFLSSTIVTDGWNFNLCKLAMRFYGLFKVGNQLTRKTIDNVRVIWNMIQLSMFAESLRRRFHSFNSGIWAFLGLAGVKRKLTSVFYASVLLLTTNCVIALSKFTAKALARGSLFHSHFDSFSSNNNIIWFLPQNSRSNGPRSNWLFSFSFAFNYWYFAVKKENRQKRWSKSFPGAQKAFKRIPIFIPSVT